MSDFEIMLAALLASVATNMWTALRLRDLRANSHRRDPKTGRLMKKGA